MPQTASFPGKMPAALGAPPAALITRDCFQNKRNSSSQRSFIDRGSFVRVRSRRSFGRVLLATALECIVRDPNLATDRLDLERDSRGRVLPSQSFSQNGPTTHKQSLKMRAVIATMLMMMMGAQPTVETEQGNVHFHIPPLPWPASPSLNQLP